MELEGGIIKEMMDIVAKRDSLINLLEEDRLRCINIYRSSFPKLFHTLNRFKEEEHIECPFIMLIFLLIAFIMLVFLLNFTFSMHV